MQTVLAALLLLQFFALSAIAIVLSLWGAARFAASDPKVLQAIIDYLERQKHVRNKTKTEGDTGQPDPSSGRPVVHKKA